MEYTPDNDALRAKQAEIDDLIAGFTATHPKLNAVTARGLLGRFVTLSPPMEPPPMMQMITVGTAGRGGGTSRKPGNITLRWGELIELISDVTLAGGGAIEAPWLRPFAALYIWSKFWSASKKDIDEMDAFVIYTLWSHRNGYNKISEEDGFARAAELAGKHSIPPLSRRQFTESVNKLVEMKCITLDGGIIWLREWVRVTY